MIVALILLAYTLGLLLAGPRWLTRARWVDRAPRLGIVAWQALSAAVISGVVLAGLALAVPMGSVSAGLAGLLRACAMALRAQYATPGGAAAGITGATVALVLAGRCAYCVMRSLFGAARGRARHREALALTGQLRPDVGGAVVLADEEPAVYCVPGRDHRIVVTSGALELLDDDQLAAALAHERAHLDQRHDLVIAWASGLARAFPRIALFNRGLSECRRLVELLADDVAARSSDRLTLAEALLNLAGAQTPAPALAAGGRGASARIERLIGPEDPLPSARRWRARFAVVGMLIVPLIAVATPALATGHVGYCSPQAPAANVPARH